MSKKYEYSTNSFTLTDLTIKVCVSIAPRELKSLPVFSLLVSVEKKDGENIEYYRNEAIKKAKEVIVDIAKEAAT